MTASTFDTSSLEEHAKEASDDMDTEKKRIMNTLDGIEADFAKTVDTDADVQTRSRLGVAFGRNASGGQNKEYEALSGWAAKRDFRKKWAAAELDNIVNK